MQALRTQSGRRQMHGHAVDPKPEFQESAKVNPKYTIGARKA